MQQTIKTCFVILFAALAGLLAQDSAYAQRGRGGFSRGGGGGFSGGGISRPSPSISRSPSMSRPAPSINRPMPSVNRPSPSINRPSTNRPSAGLPSRPSANRPAAGTPGSRPSGARPATGLPTNRPANGFPSGRPSQGQLNNFLNLDRPSTRPSSRPAGGAAGDFLQGRPAPPAFRPTPKPLPGERPGFGERPGQLPGNRPPLAGNRPGQRPPGNVRPPGQRPPSYRPPGYRPPRPGYLPSYGGGFWVRYPNWRWGWQNYPNNWWRWATAGAVGGWVVGNIGQPVYYDYGVNCYYEGDNVYYEGEVVGTTAEYAAEAQNIASSVPAVDPDSVQWLSLGVFALSQKDGDVEEATLYVQLAISKEGIIAGTFQNTATDKAFEVEGTIDKKTQRAAWGPVGESWPIMETGLYNLTENEAGALIHFEDGQTQQWLMTRLDEPQESTQQ